MATINPLILIPARLASTRLPNKPLAMIGDHPMIVQAWKRAMEADIAPVTVACDSEEIKDAITQVGGSAILTDPDLPSGSDRIWAALQQADPDKKHDIIINLQGDMPTLDPMVIEQVIAPLHTPEVDIATLAAEIHTQEEKANPAVVKIAMADLQQPQGTSDASQQASPALSPAHREGQQSAAGAMIQKALYFSRATIPHGEGPLYHHIGIYAYRRNALEQFVSMPPSPLEEREKLEQLRALEAGMRIDVSIVNTVPLGVDTPEQLEQARKIIENNI